MQASDAGPPVAPAGLAEEGAVDTPGEMIPPLREILSSAEETARGLLEAEDALRLLRQRFEHTEDPQLQGELAAEALQHVERQLQLTRQRRRELDKTEARLWARQNRLEQLLIHTRGIAWWRAHRNTSPEGAAQTAPTLGH
jgi:hypothetical protein